MGEYQYMYIILKKIKGNDFFIMIAMALGRLEMITQALGICITSLAKKNVPAHVAMNGTNGMVMIIVLTAPSMFHPNKTLQPFFQFFEFHGTPLMTHGKKWTHLLHEYGKIKSRRPPDARKY